MQTLYVTGEIDESYNIQGEWIQGSVIAHNTSLSGLQDRVNKDPFVVENVVSTEILEIDPKKADDRLNFLIG